MLYILKFEKCYFFIFLDIILFVNLKNVFCIGYGNCKLKQDRKTSKIKSKILKWKTNFSVSII